MAANVTRDVASGADLTLWERPIRPGIPVSARSDLVGTLGAIVRDRCNGILCILGTSHVFCPSNSSDMPIWQPNPCNQKGCDCNRIGVAIRGLRGVVSFSGHKYYVDCAVARVDEDVIRDSMIAGDHITMVGAAERGLQVWKLGAGSGKTSGIIINDRHEEVVHIDDSYLNVPNQILVQPFSNKSGQPFSVPGDSGAILLDEQHRAIGLIWAATPSGYALACPIQPILEILKIGFEVSI